MKVKMKRVLAKLMNRQMAGAFDCWAEMAEEAKVGSTVQVEPGLKPCLKLLETKI